MQASDALTIRTTPSPTGRNVGSILAGAVLRVDLRDTCLPYGAKWRYTRLLSAVGVVVREPLYIALEEVTSTGTVPLLRLVRDECGDVPPVEPEPELPEIPEETFMDWVELEVKKLNVILPFLHDKLGTDQLKALLSPQSVAAMQEVIVGASTPDVEPPPVEPDPETPPPPPVEEWPPVEPEPEPEVPPVVEPPVVAVSPAGFSTQGKKMLYKGKEFRAIMYNVREAIGAGDIMRYFTPALLRRQFEVVRLLKGKAVRFYAAHVDLPAAEAARRAEKVLDTLQEYGLYGVVALDEGAHSNFGIRKSHKNYQGKYTHDFWAGGFYEEYLPYAKEVVKRIGKHPALMMLELANEPTIPHPPDPTARQMDNMLNWIKVSSAAFNEIAPGVIISPGWISAHEMASANAYQGYKFAEKVYDLPYIKAGCIHSYQGMANRQYGDGEDHIKNEVKFNIPLYIGETGLQPELKDWGWLWKLGNDPLIVQNFFMVGQWGLMAHDGDIKEVRQVFDVGIGGPTGMVQTYDKGMPGFLWPEYVFTYGKLAETTYK
jgi:hypothetical protein